MSVGMSTEMKYLMLHGELFSEKLMYYLQLRNEFLFENQLLRFIEPMPEWDPPRYIRYINRAVVVNPNDADVGKNDTLLMPIIEN